MELLPLIIITSIVLLAFAIGFYALFVLLRRAGEQQTQLGQDQAVAAAVKAALVERGATADALSRERLATMETAATRAAELADQKLDARMRVGNEALAKNLAIGNEKLEKNMALGHQKYDASTSLVEKQTAELRSEIKRIGKMMTDMAEKAAGQHGKLVTQMQEAAKATGHLQQTTGSLREALGNSKKRGNWGERMAQDVLNFAGLKEGVNYRAQKGIDSGGRPDFTFLMPRNMVLHMDVKFPADNYLAFLDADGVDPTLADRHRKQFAKDARSRVKELADRRYQEEANSVDAVVLLIPNESIFGFVQENDPELMDIAMASKVVLCGPSTLIAVLQIIRQSMDNFMLERRSTEILDCLNGFKAEFAKYTEQLEKHGKHMNMAMNSFEKLSGTRTNVLQRNLDKIERLQSSSDQRAVEPASADSTTSIDDDGSAWPQLREVASA